MIYGISILMVIVVIVFFSVRFIEIEKKKNSNDDKTEEILAETALMDETPETGLEDIDNTQVNEEPETSVVTDNVVSEDSKDVILEESIADDLASQDSVIDDKSSKDPTSEDINSSDVESVYDDEDPQSEGIMGAESDFSEVIVPENEIDEITYGIDVAKWQGVIDWEQVKASGIEFAMIRIGYRTQVTGDIVEDPYAKYNLQQAQANNIKIGVYFFSTAINEQEAKEEAAWVTSFIAPYPITYPVVYNCEGFNDVKNRQYEMPKNERTNMAITFLDYVHKEGFTPMFYASKSELEQNKQWDTDTLDSRYKIWVAQYPEEFNPDTTVSSYSGKYDMWQYTSKGIVPGIDKAVDINIAYFGYEQEAEAKDNTPQETVTADSTALINFTKVNETVTAKIETNLRTIPSSEDAETIAMVLTYGETVIRTGIGNNGWSRVEHNGEVFYAVSSYLTTDLNYKENSVPTIDNPEAGITFTKVNEQVTAKDVTNLRLVPTTESDDTIVIALQNGEIAVRTGVGNNGWSRVVYKEQTLYALTSYLAEIENN